MSARNRRAKRQIDRLVRMDGTRARMATAVMGGIFGPGKDHVFWEACMVPLGKKLGRKGLQDRAIAALEKARDSRARAGGRA